MSDVDSVSEFSDESWDGDDEIVPTSTLLAVTDNQTVTPVRSLLHVLKVPLRSALSRKQKVASNPQEENAGKSVEVRRPILRMSPLAACARIQ